jgi:hypothetical protein
MAGYLDEYGVKDAKRAKLTKWIVVGVLSALVLGTVGYFFFQNFSEQRAVGHFIDALNAKDYPAAYKFWETPEAQKFYPFAKFNEDWGPQGTYKNAVAMKIINVDACDAGVVFSVTYPGSDAFGLWVERATGKLSFAPWPRCPGRHLQIVEFLKNAFAANKN